MSAEPLEMLRNLTGDTALVAGAGSGKTYTLVHFYLDVVQGRVPKLAGTDCTAVLALTFTEKAAEEMKERIRLLLLEEGAEDQLEKFDQAVVGTIHGFCSNLIREFALEAGIDPDFEPVDGSDLLHRAALDTCLELANRNDDDMGLLIQAMPFEGSYGLVQAVTDSLALSRTMGQPLAAIRDSLDQWAPEAARLTAEAEATIRSGLRELAATDLKPKLASTKYLERLQPEAEAPLDENLARFILDMLNRAVPKNIKPIKDELAAAVKLWLSLELEPLALDTAKAMVNVMDRVERAYARLKEEQGVKDFDDLQLIARDLLFSRPEVRAGLKDRFRLILIDEFQDTNPLQWDIFACLREASDQNLILEQGDDPSDKLTLAPDRLVVVGDAKQSIYRFRGAEVDLFSGLVEELDSAGPDKVIDLPRNYRSQPGLVRFFNAFFPFVRSLKEGSEDSGRDLSGWRKAQKWHKSELDRACVEILAIDDEQIKINDLKRPEALAVAARIRQMADTGTLRPDGNGEAIVRPYAFSEMAVLLRSLTNVHLLEEALQRWNVPYRLVKTRGGLERPEIRDLINLLEFLIRPGDDYLAACLIRSPLLALSDDSLVTLALSGDLAGFVSGRGPATGLLPEDEEQRLIRFAGLVNRLQTLRDRVTPAELVELALEETDLGAVLLAGFQGREKLASLQGFIEAVRGLTGAGLATVHDLVNRLRPREGFPEPKVDPARFEDRDAVQIMSIHGSKGLQFPAVFLPQTYTTSRGSGSPVVYRPGLGLALRIRRPQDVKTSKSHSFIRLEERNKQAEAAEAGRLLYVALTRAEERLIISGPTGEKDKDPKGNWFRQLQAFARTGAAAGLLESRSGDTDSPLVVERSGPGLVAAVERTDPGAEKVVDRVLSQPPPPQRVEISVSHLEDLDLCPRLYYRSRLMGHSPWGEGNGSDGLSPTARGLWLHKVVELADLASPGDVSGLVARAAGAEGVRVTDREMAGMTDLATRLLNHPPVRGLGDLEPWRVRRELEFSLAVDLTGQQAGETGQGMMVINGEIDLLVLTESGPLIMDWKLARPGRTDYSFQLRTYDLALARALAGGEGDPQVPLPELRLVYINPDGVTDKTVPFDRHIKSELEQRLRDLALLLIRNRGSLDPEAWPCDPAPGRRGECPFYKEGCCG